MCSLDSHYPNDPVLAMIETGVKVIIFLASYCSEGLQADLWQPRNNYSNLSFFQASLSSLKYPEKLFRAKKR